MLINYIPPSVSGVKRGTSTHKHVLGASLVDIGRYNDSACSSPLTTYRDCFQGLSYCSTISEWPSIVLLLETPNNVDR